MFAFCAAPEGGIDVGELEPMASKLLGGTGKPTIWCDDRGRAGFAAGTAGILPEDANDRQPLVAPGVAFAARARIDNRDELLEKLGIPASQWPTIADSEVFFHAYLRWEEDCVQHVYGDFAFAAWHRDSGKVVAAIDHIGTARLFYSQAGGRLIVSSQSGALLAHPRASRDLDLKALGLLAAPKIEVGSTPFQHVRTLLGGHLLTSREGTLNIRRWWQPDTTIRTRYRDPNDYVLAARETFDRAVRARLRTTGQIAAMMSGGLDSTLVAATAARQLRESGRAITAYLSVPEHGLACDVPPGWDADDSPYATAVAQMHDNMQLVKIAPGGNCTLDVVPEIHAISRTPVRNGANNIWFVQSCRAARAAGARVMLLGGKGNGTLSQEGEGALHQLVRQMKWGEAIRQARLRILREGTAALRPLARDVVGEKGRELFGRLRSHPRTRARPGEELLTADFRAAYAGILGTFAPDDASRADQVRFMTLPLKPWSADLVAQWGMEDRDPTGDRRLMELLLSFPMDAFIMGGWPRGLARAMGQGLIPDQVRFRLTRGAQVPESAGIIGLNSAKYREVLDRVESLGRLGSVLDMPRVRALLERVCAGQANFLAVRTLDRVAEMCLFTAGEHS